MLDFLIQNMLRKIDSQLFDKKVSKDLQISFSNYLDKIHYRFKFVKNVIFRSEPVDFNQNYIPLTLTNRSKTIIVNEPRNIFEKFDKIGIIGSAGSGKTTLLRHLALRCIETSFMFPIYVELRNIEIYENSFEEYIISQLGNEFSSEISFLFENGGFVFLFDGYDEIDYVEGSSFINQIDEFITKYSKNFFMISSRPGTNLESINPLYIFHIEPLNRDDIYLFLENLSIPSQLKRRIFNDIDSNDSLTQILNIPLFLALFIVTYSNSNREFFNKKSIFFRNIIDSLFSQHDSVSKLGFIRERVSDLTKDDLERISSILAFRMMFSSRYELTKDEVFTEFDHIKRSKLFDFQNEKLLFDLTITVNILINYDNQFFFPHILIMEYFSALFISKLEFETKQNLYNRLVIHPKIILSLNFYEFLNELDNKAFLRFYVLPVLDKLVKTDYHYPQINNQTKPFVEFLSGKIMDGNSNLSTPELKKYYKNLISEIAYQDDNSSDLLDVL